MIKIYAKHIVFKECVESLYQTLRELSIDCLICNSFELNDDSLYIIFGAHELVAEPPKHYIVYQLEQTPKVFTDKNIQTSIWTSEYVSLLRNAAEVWDFSIENIKTLRKTFRLSNVHFVGLGYSSCLEEASKELKKLRQSPDIDILFSGSESARRKKMFQALKENLPKSCVIEWRWNSVWGEERAALVARSKIVLNIHHDISHGLLEIPRLIYLLSQKQFVISERGRNIKSNSKWEKYINFLSSKKSNGASTEELVEACKTFLYSSNADEKRKQIAKQGYAWIKTKTFGLPSHFMRKYSPDTTSKTTTEKTTEKTTENTTKTTTEKNKKRRKKRKRKKKIQWYHPIAIKPAETQKHDDGSFALVLPSVEDDSLPSISIITPTRNRRHLFSLAMRNWLLTEYPKEKMEWIIIDDGEENIKDLVENDKRIRYINLQSKHPLPIGHKRNLCVQFAKNDIILCMDDDDYYVPEHALSRTKALLQYQKDGVGCVGCSAMGAMDLTSDKSSFISNGKRFLTESTMAFTKKFWEQRRFSPQVRSGEYFKFLQYRQSSVRSIPYQFVSVAFFHGSNMSGLSRKITKTQGSYHTIHDMVDEDTEHFIEELKKKLP